MNPGSLGRRIAREMKPYRARVGGLLVLDLLATPLTLLSPIGLMIAVDSVLGSKPLPGWIDAVLPGFATSSSSRLLLTAVLFHLVVVLLTRLQQLGNYVLHTKAGETVTLGFRARLFRHAQRLSLAFHDRKGSADSLYRIQYDALSLSHILQSLIPLVSAFVMLAATITVIVGFDWQLAIVAIGVTPMLFVLARAYSRRIRGHYRRLKDLDTAALSVLQEVLTAVRVVKAFGREDREHDRFVARAGEKSRARVRISFTEGLFSLLIQMTTALGTALVLFIGVQHVQSGVLRLGELLAVMAYLLKLYGPLEDISQKFGDLQSSVTSAERAFQLLDELPEVAERPDARPIERAAGEIEFRRVGFAYEPGQRVLRGVSFRVPAGSSLGIAGRTGAGKTTLVSLLMRFYDPTTGRILLDGVDLRDYRLADLREQFALVLQDPVLFSASIRENIAYGRLDAGEEEIEDAARAANAHDFIQALPDGYETLVGERGMRLSGGERQRISLARAFLKDAPILILDEPTSSVDVGTEAVIMDAMRRLMHGRTTFMIAHRLGTLDYCDARIEVDGGRVTEETRPSGRGKRARV